MSRRYNFCGDAGEDDIRFKNGRSSSDKMRDRDPGYGSLSRRSHAPDTRLSPNRQNRNSVAQSDLHDDSWPVPGAASSTPEFVTVGYARSLGPRLFKILKIREKSDFQKLWSPHKFVVLELCQFCARSTPSRWVFKIDRRFAFRAKISFEKFSP